MIARSEAGLHVQVTRLRKVYRGRGGSEVTAISELSFQVQPGERVCLVGRTGCGKSTLFRILAGLENPSCGRVRVAGRDPARDFDWFRGRLALVFQEDRLLPWRTAWENAALGLEFLRVQAEERRQRARRWLVRLGLEDFLEAYPAQLSGGMRQRVALARAFVLQPELILADEAFGHLDEVTSARLRADFLQAARARNTTVLQVTHQLDEAIESAQRLLVLGQPGHLLAELDVTEEVATRSPAGLRQHVQRLLDSNLPESSSG